jgi:methylated-DNA-[protein]-cysteine S-methyltransferase
VPCHRVLGSGKAITGYSGGIDKKKFLLELEKIEFTE